MSLNKSKKEAILHWWNSMTSDCLQNINQLEDGKHFCSMINSVFDRSPELQTEEEPCPMDVEMEPEDVKEPKDDDKECNVKMKPDDVKEPTDDNKEYNIEMKPIVNEPKDDNKECNAEIKPEDVKEYKDDNKDFNIEMEPDNIKEHKDDCQECKVEMESDKEIEREDNLNECKVQSSKSNEATTEVPVIVQKECNNSKESEEEVEKSADNGCNDDGRVKAVSVENTNLHLITMRYKSVQGFLDGMYQMESDSIISYAECMKSSELELAKVAVLVLSLVVKKYVESKNNQLNTLTHLDFKIQEDIQECLSILLQENKSGKKNLHTILTKSAKYKTSPRKSPRTAGTPISTPQRRRSSLYRGKQKSVLNSTPAAEEMYSNSPLKIFLDSPQFRNQVLACKNKELVKTRNFLHAEEMRSEDLQLDLNNMKKKLGVMEKENKNLKKENHKLQLLKTDFDEKIKAFQASFEKKQLDVTNKSIEDLRERIKMKDKNYEEDITSRENKIKLLEEKVKLDASKLSLNEDLELNLRQKDKENCKMLLEIEKLKKNLEEAKEEQMITKSLYEEKLAEAKAVTLKEPVSPVGGECLGSVIDVENRMLREEREVQHTKLLEALCLIEKLLKERGDTDDAIDNIKTRLNYSIKNESDMSVIALLDMPAVSEIEKENILLKYPKVVNKNTHSSSSDCDNSVVTMEIEEVTPRQCAQKEKSNISESNEPVLNNNLGSLWIHFNDSGSETSLVSNTNDLTKVNEGLGKELGFSEAEYSSKLEDAKKVLISLKEFFSTKSANGYINSQIEWDRILMCDENCIKCLYYIRDSILRCENNNSKDFMINYRALHDFDSSTETPLLENENDKFNVTELSSQIEKKEIFIKEQASIIQENISVIAEKDAMLQKKDILLQEQDTLLKQRLTSIEKQETSLSTMKNELQALQQRNKRLAKHKHDLEKVTEKLDNSVKNLTMQLNLKTTQYDVLNSAHAKLANDMIKTSNKYEKQLTTLNYKMLKFGKTEKEFEAKIEKEKKTREGLLIQLEKARFRIEDLKRLSRNFEASNKSLTAQNKELEEELTAEREKLQKEHEQYQEDLQNLKNANKFLEAEERRLHSCIEDLKKKLYNKSDSDGIRNSFNINVEINGKKPYTTSGTSKNLLIQSHIEGNKVMVPDSANDSLSNSMFNKSLHGSLMLPTEDEAGYMSHSSLEEIKKDYRHCEDTNHRERAHELNRRNTMCMPHLQTSYPVEVQCMSPLTSSLLARRKKTAENEKYEVSSNEVSSKFHVLKKRKLSEVTSETSNARPEDEASTSQMPETPDSKAQKKTFKTPSSLTKLLKFRRNPRHSKKPKSEVA